MKITDYILHLRPKSWAPATLFALTGYVASPIKVTTGTHFFIDVLGLYLTYGMLAFGGTVALNSAYDQDDGDLNYLKNPPPKPKHLAFFGIFISLLAILVATHWGNLTVLCALAACLLSILYSFPFGTFRGKEVGVLDNLINALGCGAIGFFWGWSFTGAALDSRAVSLAIAFTILVFASYPATQIFQLNEKDTYQTAKNYTSLLGAQRALQLGCVLFVVGLGFLILEFFNRPNRVLLTNISTFIFFATYFFAIYQTYYWSQAPFQNAALKQKKLILTLLAARIFWMIGAWLS